MEIANGKMEENTNVQQSITSQILSQRWILKPFSQGGNYYYIHSAKDERYVLKTDSDSN